MPINQNRVNRKRTSLDSTQARYSKRPLPRDTARGRIIEARSPGIKTDKMVSPGRIVPKQIVWIRTDSLSWKNFKRLCRHHRIQYSLLQGGECDKSGKPLWHIAPFECSGILLSKLICKPFVVRHEQVLNTSAPRVLFPSMGKSGGYIPTKDGGCAKVDGFTAHGRGMQSKDKPLQWNEGAGGNIWEKMEWNDLEDKQREGLKEKEIAVIQGRIKKDKTIIPYVWILGKKYPIRWDYRTSQWIDVLRPIRDVAY